MLTLFMNITLFEENKITYFTFDRRGEDNSIYLSIMLYTLLFLIKIKNIQIGICELCLG